MPFSNEPAFLSGLSGTSAFVSYLRLQNTIEFLSVVHQASVNGERNLKESHSNAVTHGWFLILIRSLDRIWFRNSWMLSGILTVILSCICGFFCVFFFLNLFLKNNKSKQNCQKSFDWNALFPLPFLFVFVCSLPPWFPHLFSGLMDCVSFGLPSRTLDLIG